MWRKLKNFVFYNNGFTMLVLVAVLTSGSALAANEEVRQGLISSEESIVEVDNSYIRNIDLDDHDFEVEIVEVERDDVNYYVTYEFHTIELVDGAWKKIVKQDVLTIHVDQLGDRDLGLYAAEQLQQLVDSTRRFLTEVQTDERNKGLTQKTVARTYDGMIGKFLEPEKLTFSGYDPVIEPPVIVKETTPILNQEDLEPVPIEEVTLPNEDSEDDKDNEGPEIEVPDNDEPDIPVATSTASTSEPSATTTPADVIAPVITLNGEAEMELELDMAYTEPGAIAVDDVNGDISSYIVISGVVNTVAVGDYTVSYSVADAAGNSSTVTRIVKVIEPPQVPEPEVTASTSSTTVN